jgi:hypothetical protein
VALFDKWAFVEKHIDQEQWYIKLTGGMFDGIVYKYTDVKMHPDDESISFDYVVEDCDNDPTGTDDFNQAVGDILKHVIFDAIDARDYAIGEDGRDTNNTI